MSLAILTPQGRVHAQEQIDAAQIVFRRSKSRCHHSNLKDKAPIDCVITEDGCVVGVAEIKSRPNMTLAQLQNEFKNEWLISASKVDALKLGSIMLNVPGYGILYLKQENLCLMLKITDESGAVCCDYYRKETVTQATCNGGEALRVNAFINMSNAKVYRK